MQRVIQRAQRAHNAAVKKAKKNEEHKLIAESRQRIQERRRLASEVNANIKEARKNRREDWLTGPLAPRRDVGEIAESYATTSVYNIHLPNRDPHERIKWSPIGVGDRVVVTKGRDRGRIGTVGDVDKKKVAVQVKDMNTVDVKVPDWMKREDGDDRTIVPAEKLIPMEHLKLVYPLPDPVTGVPRDVVIDRVVKVGSRNERLIPGANIIIPRAPKTIKRGQDGERYEGDTRQISVEEQTFDPCLLHPPIPMSVIDELRNKYSKYRQRHDWEYVQKKELEEERVEKRKQLGKTMRTPLQELAELKAWKKKEQERELTEEQLARIGEVMEQERARSRRIQGQLAGLQQPPPMEQSARIENSV